MFGRWVTSADFLIVPEEFTHCLMCSTALVLIIDTQNIDVRLAKQR